MREREVLCSRDMVLFPFCILDSERFCNSKSKAQMASTGQDTVPKLKASVPDPTSIQPMHHECEDTGRTLIRVSEDKSLGNHSQKNRIQIQTQKIRTGWSKKPKPL